jgi:hypothetical protein
MKKIALFIALALFFGCKNNKLPPKSTQLKPHSILIEFNQFDYEPFGVLTKNINPFLQRLEYGRDTFSIQNDSFSLYFLRTKLDAASFEYKEDNYKVIGQFVLPNFYHLQSILKTDAETFITNTIKIKPYIQPIRSGEWIIEENGKTKKINYNIVIDESELKREDSP